MHFEIFYILIVLHFVTGQSPIIEDGGIPQPGFTQPAVPDLGLQQPGIQQLDISQPGIQPPIIPQTNPFRDPLFWRFYDMFTNSRQGVNNPINAIRDNSLIAPPVGNLLPGTAIGAPIVPQDIVGNNNVGLPGDPTFNSINSLRNNPSRVGNMVLHRRNPAIEHSRPIINGISNSNLLLTLALSGGSEGIMSNPLVLNSLLNQGNGQSNNLLQILALSGGGEGGLAQNPLLLSQLLGTDQPQTANSVLKTLALSGELQGLNPIVLQYLLQNRQIQQTNTRPLLQNLPVGVNNNAELQQPGLLNSGQSLTRLLTLAGGEESPLAQNPALLRQLLQSNNNRQFGGRSRRFPRSNIIPLLMALGGEAMSENPMLMIQLLRSLGQNQV